MNSLISYFEAAYKAFPSKKMSILEALTEIKTGVYRQKIEKLRTLSREKGSAKESPYSSFKKSFPGYTFSGTFNPKRTKDNLDTPSGFMCLDADHVEDLAAKKSKLTLDSYIAFAFISPGGDGLKIGIKIDQRNWDLTFKSAEEYFQSTYNLTVDPQRKDISGLCFVSYDPSIFINPKAEMFPVVEKTQSEAPKFEKKVTHESKAKKYCIGALNDACQKISTAAQGTRNATVNKESFGIGQIVAAGGLDHFEAESALLEAAILCGLPKHEAETAVKSGLTSGAKEPRKDLPSEDYSKKSSEENSRRPLADPNDTRPSIIWEGGELSGISDQAENELAKIEGVIYQRGNLIVHPVRGKPSTVRGLTFGGNSLSIVQADVAYLTDVLTRQINWKRFDQRAKDYVRINAPKQVAETILSRFGKWKADPLIAIVETPVIRPDGTILEKPGYDKQTGLFFDSGECSFPEIPKKPTQEDALKNVAIFKELLGGFPFETEFDFSVALSAILTALIRRVLKSAPMFAFRAPKMGSGKSLLADVVSLVATGKTATTMSATDDPEEEKKRLLSVLMSGDSVVCVDNVEKPYGSDSMCTILTQDTWTQRVLGGNSNATVPTCATWLMTGNNITFVGDITTRILPCNLDPQCERPEERDFSVNLYDYVPLNRGKIVCAGLTILKAYIEAGKPKQNFKQYGRFEEWSGLIRSALVWCGLADPCLSRKGIEESDPIRCQLKAVFEGWYKAFPGKTVTVGEVIKTAEYWEDRMEEGESIRYRPFEQLFNALYEVAPGKHEGIHVINLGRWLAKHEKRIEDGFKLEKMEIRSKQKTWRVSLISKVSNQGSTGSNSCQCEKVSKNDAENLISQDSFQGSTGSTGSNSYQHGKVSMNKLINNYDSF